jgi:hypothetical protein
MSDGATDFLEIVGHPRGRHTRHGRRALTPKNVLHAFVTSGSAERYRRSLAMRG